MPGKLVARKAEAMIGRQTTVQNGADLDSLTRPAQRGYSKATVREQRKAMVLFGRHSQKVARFLGEQSPPERPIRIRHIFRRILVIPVIWHVGRCGKCPCGEER